MTKKKADKQREQHFGSIGESTVVSPGPQEIRRKRRLAYIQAVCLLEYLAERGKTAERFILV
jgi:hypothetical protein